MPARSAPAPPRIGQAFLDRSGMKHAVLFPTSGLAHGVLRDVEYTVSLSHAFNDYIADRYARVDERLHPVALAPMQDPELAAVEMRRAVKDLGLISCMVPAAGLPFRSDLGHPHHWPIYQAADELDCMLGVHGGFQRRHRPRHLHGSRLIADAPSPARAHHRLHLPRL